MPLHTVYGCVHVCGNCYRSVKERERERGGGGGGGGWGGGGT